MAAEIPGKRYTLEAAGDLSAAQFKFVKMSGSTITGVTAATDLGIGVLQNKPNYAGAPGTVMVDGQSFVMASKAIAAGVQVFLAADGSVTDTAAANKAVGIAMSAASGAGKVLSVLLKPLGALS